MEIVCSYTGEKCSPIYIKHETGAFPFDDWDDFCLPIIAAWIHETLMLETQNITSNQFMFMDGPWYLQCKKEKDLLFMQGVDDHGDGKVVFSEYITLQDWKKQLQQVAKAIIEAPVHHPDQLHDLAYLKYDLQRLIGA